MAASKLCKAGAQAVWWLSWGSWLCSGSRAGVGLEWAGKVPSEVLWFLGAVSDLCISSGHGIQADGSFV